MDTKNNLQVRFGSTIMEKGFTSIPNIILDYYSKLGISANEMMCIIHIWQYWWSGERNPFPSVKEIARRMNKTERMVANYLESLESKGFLIRKRRVYAKTGLRATTEYDFTPLILKVKSLYLQDKQEEEPETIVIETVHRER